MSWREQQSSWVCEVGESSKGDDPERGVVVYPMVVQDARSCFRTMGVSFKGTEKGFLDLLTLVDEGQHSVSALKKKLKREVKNLECLINFNVSGVGSSRVGGKRLGVYCSISYAFWFFSVVLHLFSVFLLFWCHCMLSVCLGAPLRFFNAISFLTYIKKKSLEKPK
jgi:hypothetical protein